MLLLIRLVSMEKSMHSGTLMVIVMVVILKWLHL